MRWIQNTNVFLWSKSVKADSTHPCTPKGMVTRWSEPSTAKHGATENVKCVQRRRENPDIPFPQHVRLFESNN